MKVAELFAGVGGFRLGLEKSDYEIIVLTEDYGVFSGTSTGWSEFIDAVIDQEDWIDDEYLSIELINP